MPQKSAKQRTRAFKKKADQQFRAVMELLLTPGPVNEDFVIADTDAAARAGSPDAALLAAAIAGAGYGRPRDWDAALDWLAIAAARGAESARAQLRLLAHADTARSDWRALAKAIDVAAWSAARPSGLIEQEPRIGLADGFLEAPVCAWLIERAGPLQAPSLVYDAQTGRAVQHDVRTNTVSTFQLAEMDLPILLVRERIANTLGVPVSHLESFAVFPYLPGQRFASHADYLSPMRDGADITQNGQRVLTFLTYLNDDFDEGETHFIDIGRKIRGGVGDALFFHNVTENGAPDERSTHEGLPPSRGEKWLLSQFIRDKPQVFG